MSEKFLWFATAVALIVVTAGAIWLFMAESPKKVVMGGTQEEAVQKFADECTADMLRRGALKYDNTAAQIASTCKCFGTEIYPVYKNMTHEEAAQFGKEVEGRRQALTIARKCISQIGLDGSDIWFQQ